ncbi:MAG TPA: HNH endonuclease signature motif containing protein [Candidatus Nanoarchaeia archaeon]|nr:HNH endonuclease signature motif containing protein [Candidatus Nanoarchaeia archaeon]
MTKNMFGNIMEPIKIKDLFPTKPKGGRTACPKAVKETVWRRYNGNRMHGKCYVCKCPVPFTNFEVGHNKAHSSGGKWSVGNCRPICRSCNRSMGKMSIEAFKKKYFTKGTKTGTEKGGKKGRGRKQGTRRPTTSYNILEIPFGKFGLR